MQIGNSSMVEHVSRPHKVPSSNLGRLLFYLLEWLQSTSSKFLRCSSSLVAVRAIIPHPTSPSRSQVKFPAERSLTKVSGRLAQWKRLLVASRA